MDHFEVFCRECMCPFDADFPEGCAGEKCWLRRAFFEAYTTHNDRKAEVIARTPGNSTTEG